MLKRRQVLEAIEGFNKIAFRDVSKDVEEKAKEFIDKLRLHKYQD
jgi:hypothetical protein